MSKAVQIWLLASFCSYNCFEALIGLPLPVSYSTISTPTVTPPEIAWFSSSVFQKRVFRVEAG